LGVVAEKEAHEDRARVQQVTGNRAVLAVGGGYGIAADGNRAFVTSQGFQKGSIGEKDLTTGDTRLISEAFGEPEAIAIDGHRLLVVEDYGVRAIHAIDIATGESTVVSGEGVGAGPEFQSPRGIALVGTTALVGDADLNAVFAVDLLTGDRVIISIWRGF
jgi:hypothetical protein